jgi:predicted nucleotidyltransferase
MSLPFRRFLDRLVRTLRPERVVLFGSRARGTHRETSDYDLLIVGARFLGVPWVERAPLAIRLWDLPVDLEPICLTPEEFRRRSKEVSIVGEALRNGVVVYP